MKNISTKSITKIGILSAIVIILSLSPIGFIPLGPIRITTVHIPIILIALIEKPTVSFFVGLIFGLFSFFQHLSGISPLSFMFINPMVSILPRALIGIGTYYTFIFVKKYIKNIFNVVFASMVGTMINTFGVLSMAYIFCSKHQSCNIFIWGCHFKWNTGNNCMFNTGSDNLQKFTKNFKILELKI